MSRMDAMVHGFAASWIGSIVIDTLEDAIGIMCICVLCLSFLAIVALCLWSLVYGLKMIYEHLGRPMDAQFQRYKKTNKGPRSEVGRVDDYEIIVKREEEINRLREEIRQLKQDT